jgi:hypothetical protein
MTRDFAPTNAAEATSKAMTPQTETQKTLLTIPKVQQGHIKAVAEKLIVRADRPFLSIAANGGLNLQQRSKPLTTVNAHRADTS